MQHVDDVGEPRGLVTGPLDKVLLGVVAFVGGRRREKLVKRKQLPVTDNMDYCQIVPSIPENLLARVTRWLPTYLGTRWD